MSKPGRKFSPNLTILTYSSQTYLLTELQERTSEVCDTKLSMTIGSRTLCDQDLDACLQDTWEMNYRFYKPYPSDI